MIKAVFFDVDGTLVSFQNREISDGLRDDLLELQQRGIKIFVATGRAGQDLARTGMLRDVGFDGYVTLNGQCCYEAGGAVYRDEPICRSDLQAAYQVLRNNPELPALMEGNGASYLTQINDRVREVYDYLHTELYEVRTPVWMLEEKIYQFVPFVDRREEELFLSVMPHCTYTRWHSKGIDILPQGRGKADGVLATMERYGLAREEVMVVGDGDNDKTMMEIAGISVAMGNGIDEVKCIADYVTGRAEENGVSKALRHFRLLSAEE